MSDDRARLLSKSRKKGSSKEQVKGPTELNKPGSPTVSPTQASPAAISISGKFTAWEGQPPKNLDLGMPALEAKPTVSCSTAVSGEDAKPADVSGKEPVAGMVVLEGKPKHQGGRGKGRKAGEEAAGSPLEGKMVGVPALEAKPTVSCSAAVSGEDAKSVEFGRAEGGRGKGRKAGEEAAGSPSEEKMLGVPALETKTTVSCSTAGNPSIKVAVERRREEKGCELREAARFLMMEGKMLGVPALEAKPTVSCSAAVSGEDAKPVEFGRTEGGRGRGGKSGEEAASSPLEGKMLGMPALEAKPTVSCSSAVSGEDAKPVEFGRAEVGCGRGGRAGEEAAGSPLEGKMLEASKERAFPGKSSLVITELAPLATAGALSGDGNVSSPWKSGKAAFGSGEDAFSKEAHPDAAKPLVPGQGPVGDGTIPLADTNEAVCSSPSEKPAVAVLKVEASQPNKRSSSGKGRRPEDSLDQQPFLHCQNGLHQDSRDRET
uniref:Uncharacterized protein n=1 Tax=Sphaerodactylus townsendi TaxID=933632 RepID=A0ACB8FWT3_9SAUR